MTNEEKAKEIGRKWYNDDAPLVAYRSALQMAKWKDDRFYTILACVQYSLEKSGVSGVDEFINGMKKQWEE